MVGRWIYSLYADISSEVKRSSISLFNLDSEKLVTIRPWQDGKQLLKSGFLLTHFL